MSEDLSCAQQRAISGAYVAADPNVSEADMQLAVRAARIALGLSGANSQVGAIGSTEPKAPKAPTLSPFDAEAIKRALLAAPIDPRHDPETTARALMKAFAVVDASISPAASGS